MSCANEDEDYFDMVTKSVVSEARLEKGFDAGIIARQHPSVRKRAVAYIIRSATGLNPELVHLKMVEEILEGGTVQIIGDTVIRVRNSVLYINPQEETTEEWECDFSSLKLP